MRLLVVDELTEEQYLYQGQRVTPPPFFFNIYFYERVAEEERDRVLLPAASLPRWLQQLGPAEATNQGLHSVLPQWVTGNKYLSYFHYFSQAISKQLVKKWGSQDVNYCP